MIRIAINGYGRIGRNVLRAFYENQDYKNQIKIVAINDLANAKISAHLTQYDSVHGKFNAPVELRDQVLWVNDDPIEMIAEPDPSKLPWDRLKVDVVLECTGFFTSREKAYKHIQAGATKVIVSAPGTDLDATVVYGVNHSILTSSHQIISNASCTTNCLAPLVKVLNTAIGIERGVMTTIHSYTNDQNLLDVAHKDIYRARSATQSMIPTKTGAAAAVGLVLPELAGKLDGLAVRVPVANVSLVDLVLLTLKDTGVSEVNELIKVASMQEMAGIIEYNQAPLVSVDFNHNPASCCFDASQTNVQGNLVKVMAWYDNEWAFSNRMLDTTIALMEAE